MKSLYIEIERFEEVAKIVTKRFNGFLFIMTYRLFYICISKGEKENLIYVWENYIYICNATNLTIFKNLVKLSSLAIYLRIQCKYNYLHLTCIYISM